MNPALIRLLLGAVIGVFIGNALIGEKKMKNCSKKIQTFHDDKVKLDTDTAKDLKAKRETNRTRIKDNIKDVKNKPRFHGQGSMSMKTTIQCPLNGLDLDDGVYFKKTDLVGPRGAEYTPREAKEKVLDAVTVEQFEKAPEILKNCVRVYYQGGYHIDLPVYRELDDGKFELASTEWKISDPKEVTKWFRRGVKKQSPEGTEQLREVVRLLKKFCKKQDENPSGFIVSTLVIEECFKPNAERIDTALYDTMKSIYDRFQSSGREVEHPVVDGEKLSKGPDDPKIKNFEDRLKRALDDMEELFDSDCSQKRAYEIWGKVLGDKEFFTWDAEVDFDEDGAKEAIKSRDHETLIAAAVAAPSILRGDVAKAVNDSQEKIEQVRKRGQEGYG
jgi:hypothetical protein